jgi:dTDP-4-dehydrorhamnose 3,5-epimerase-like enzyme
MWNDPDVGIDWPTKELQVSSKDQKGCSLADLNYPLPPKL